MFHGVPAIRGFLEDWLIGYDEWENHWDEMQEVGDGIVFAVNCQDGTPAGSDGRVQERYALTFTFGAFGLIVRIDGAHDIAGARADAEGLAAERAPGTQGR